MTGAETLRKIAAKPAAALVAGAMLASLAATAEARVTQIVIDAKVSPAFEGASFGSGGEYETIAGRAFGELDPNDPQNTIIQDIELAPRNADGKVEYTRFVPAKPIDMTKASRMMWHDVPNRGGRIAIVRASARPATSVSRAAGRATTAGARPCAAADNDYGRGAGRAQRRRLGDHRPGDRPHHQRVAGTARSR